MSRFRATTAFPILDPAAAGDAQAGQIDITVEFVRNALEQAVAEKQQRRPEAGVDRLVARPLDPATGRITSG